MIKLVATAVVAVLGVVVRGPGLSLGTAVGMMAGVAVLGLMWAFEGLPQGDKGQRVGDAPGDKRGEPVSETVANWKGV